jgi:hypothetical protein
LLQGRDPAIVHVRNLVSEIEDAGVVCDDDDGPIGTNRRRAQQFHHCVACPPIQSRRWLIANNELWLVDQRPGQCDSLLLAARKFRRKGVGSMSHAQGSQEFFASLDGLLSFGSTG